MTDKDIIIIEVSLLFLCSFNNQIDHGVLDILLFQLKENVKDVLISQYLTFFVSVKKYPIVQSNVKLMMNDSISQNVIVLDLMMNKLNL